MSSHGSEQELRRSNRTKQAPVHLVLSGLNSKSYSPDVTPILPVSNDNVVLATTTREKSRKIKFHEISPATNTNTISQSQESSESDYTLSAQSQSTTMMVSSRRNRSKSPIMHQDVASQQYQRPKRKKGSVDLDDYTLMLVKEHLQERKDDVLNENEVIDDTLFLLKAAREKTRTYVSDVHGVKYDSDDDQSIFDMHFLHEQDYTFGRDLVKDVVSKLKETTPAAEKVRKFDSILNNATTEPLDDSTINWIKRAAGLHRHASSAELLKSYSKADPTKSYRVSTRRQQENEGGRSTKRIKKENGLDLMVEAVKSIEKDLGRRFSVLRFRNSSPHKDSISKVSAIRRKGAEEKTRTARSKEIDSKNAKKHLRMEEHAKAKLDKQRVKIPSLRICTSLRVLDQVWHSQMLSNQFTVLNKTKSETAEEYDARRSIPLHPQFVQAGIIHRPPQLDAFISQHHTNVALPSSKISGPKLKLHLVQQQHDEQSEESDIDVEGPPALFSTYEHFYSDIDRGWYKDNVVAKTLHVSVDTPMSFQEWKSLRKRCNLKPRRFSTQFIAFELKNRNEYRRTVRTVQCNPYHCPTNFPYNVYKTLDTGTIVRAYCKGSHNIQRGTVVSYDPKNAMYLIKFKMDKYGYEYCPDTDVASCNVPDVLLHHGGMGSFVKLRNIASPSIDLQLSSKPFIQDIETKLESINRNLLITSSTIVDEIANYDAFLMLMEVIDVARSRKNIILSLISDTNTLGVDQLPLGEEIEDVDGSDRTGTFEQSLILPKVALHHIEWLHYHLERTNHILNVAITYLELLYGETFFPKTSQNTTK